MDEECTCASPDYGTAIDCPIHGKKEIPYDRKILVEVLIYHWPTRNSGCHCGWGELGKLFPVHVVEVYEQVIRAGW